MACRSFMAVSIDGFIARRNGSVDWLKGGGPAGTEDYGYSEFISEIDVLLMGRRTFETVLGFGSWPYEKPVFILSRSRREVPAALSGKARYISMSPAQAVEHLTEQGLRRIYVDGGVTVQSFIAAGLLDEIVLTTVPLLLGGGYRLFGDLEREVSCTLTGSKAYPDGFLQSRYRLGYGV